MLVTMLTDRVVASAGSAMWGVAGLDLPAYLGRIGDSGELAPTFETLRRLHRQHVATFCFENLDAVLGRPIRLDLPSVADKLVRRRRGGYCHEQNLLFAAVLECLGLPVRRLLARVVAPDGSPRPRAHSCLVVDVDGQSWLADVGFGCEGLLEPIALASTARARQGDWQYRVRSTRDGWLLETVAGRGWIGLYSFTVADFLPPDFEMASYFLSTHPHSPFSRQVIVQRGTGEVRHALRGDELTVSRPDGTVQTRRLAHGEFAALLEDVFGLQLANDELERLWRAARG